MSLLGKKASSNLKAPHRSLVIHIDIEQSTFLRKEIPHVLGTLMSSIRIIHWEPFYAGPIWKKWGTQDTWETKDLLLFLN